VYASLYERLTSTSQNYVVQYVLEYGKQHDRALVISKLRGQMLNMSRHKFASNVCEKALLTADPESRRALIQEMMTSKQDGVSPIATMMKDQYASESRLAIPLFFLLFRSLALLRLCFTTSGFCCRPGAEARINQSDQTSVG
jgi:hypothetical protein